MSTLLRDILGPGAAIARRLGDRYEFRPQQLEMATAVADAIASSHHLMVEAGTGVGKSFAYLLPAIDYAVKNKKRVVISTHTISLQEQLIDKDIPLLRSVYPDEFSAVLVKGRSNYLCQRRMEQARTRQGVLFDHDRHLQSLWMVEDWAQRTTDGSLADLPALPEPDVWDKVCAEAGNCMGKKCRFYDKCFWQSAKRRMASGNVLVVNHALFFSDLALRMAGVTYLPKYDVAILDEAHTIEDVAGQHFGIKFSEAGLKYNLRTLYDPRRGRGLLSVHGHLANDAIGDVVDLYALADRFFEQAIHWHKHHGQGNGRIREKNVFENELTPKLRDLAKHLKAMLGPLTNEEEIAELSSSAAKVSVLAESLEAILTQTMDDAVYWLDVAGRTPQRVTLHAAPINVAEGLRKNLFDPARSVILTSATLCTTAPATIHGTKGDRSLPRGTGYQPVTRPQQADGLVIRQGAYLPHWTRDTGTYHVCFRLADSLPNAVLEEWLAERKQLTAKATEAGRPLSKVEAKRLEKLHSEKVEQYLDAGHGQCWLKVPQVASLMADELKHFAGDRYQLLAWTVMPNHVHAVLKPNPGYDLPQILHSWKSFVANKANALLGRSGTFWQAEYYDHLVRDADDLLHCVKYAWSNPDTAGLENWPWRDKDDELLDSLLSGTGYQPVVREADAKTQNDGLVAHATQETPPAFAYIASRLGVVRAKTLQLGSPYDYAAQATLYIETTLPDPADRTFTDAACTKILHYLKQTNGGAFVLFTSYKALLDTANRLKPDIDAMDLPLLVQGQGAPRRVLLERFRSTPNSVLFGTSSFWQGIDVQGDALRNVIIVKLPFAVPDEPITEARLDAIKRQGGNPFMEYSIPEAVIKLKQGFGRLIRSKSDTGIVVLLDSRVKTKRYGQLFLDALPECKRVEVR